MPILMTLLSIIGAAYFWSGRARNARDAAEDIVHVASDVRLAFRRMGFKRKTNIHPVDAIEDNDQLTAIIAKPLSRKRVLSRWMILCACARRCETNLIAPISGLRI